MSDKQRYNVNSILAISRIPEDRLPAFLEEFPHLLRHIRSTLALQEQIYRQAGVEYTDADLERVLVGGEWIDDDAGNIDIAVGFHAEGSDEARINIAIHENHKTGAFSINGGGQA